MRANRQITCYSEMESPYVNINGQKLEEQMKPDASILRKRVRQNLFFSLHKQNLNQFEWKFLQHFAKLKSKLESMIIVWKPGIFSLIFKNK